MKISQEQIEKISQKFDSLKDVTDFIDLLNITYCYYYKKNNTPFNLSRINYYAYQENYRYYTFKIKKRNGTLREISSPSPFLKLIQKCINVILQIKFKHHHSSHGFLQNRSIISNAQGHVGKNYVLNIDLKDFFGSINFRRVKTVLELSPFNLSNNREEIAFYISNLCSHEDKLPQGAPTSPILTNIVCQRLDRKLYQFSRTNKCKYTRYADDITFSSNNQFYNELFLKEVREIILLEGFILNDNKTRLQDWKSRQEVTGIVVNKKVNVNREFIRNIRATLNNYDTKGYIFAQRMFERHWIEPKVKAPSFVNSVKGQIEYLGMVRGKNDPIYIKLKTAYLHSFSEYIIDYSFLNNELMKRQLMLDNKRMIDVINNAHLEKKEKYVNFCVQAFFQIEELINYHLTNRFTFDTLINELTTHTLLTKKQLKDKNNVSLIPSVYKIFLFEYYFYFRPGVYYDSVITKIRIIRNNELHRQTSILKTDEEILLEHHQLAEKIKLFKQQNPQGEYKSSFKERHLENEYKVIQFLKEENYQVVFNILNDVARKIKRATNKN